MADNTVDTLNIKVKLDTSNLKKDLTDLENLVSKSNKKVKDTLSNASSTNNQLSSANSFKAQLQDIKILQTAQDALFRHQQQQLTLETKEQARISKAKKDNLDIDKKATQLRKTELSIEKEQQNIEINKARLEGQNITNESKRLRLQKQQQNEDYRYTLNRNISGVFGFGFKSLLGVAGLSYGLSGITSYVAEKITTNAGLARLSDKVGTTVEHLSGFDNIIKEVGGDVQAYHQSLINTTLQIGQAQLGQNGAFMGLLSFLGVRIPKNGDPQEVMIREMEALRQNKLHLTKPELNLLGTQLGLTQDQLNMVFSKDVNGKYDYPDIRKAVKQAASVTDKEARDAKVAQKSFVDAQLAWSQVTNKWVDPITPAMVKLADAINKMAGITDKVTDLDKLRKTSPIVKISHFADQTAHAIDSVLNPIWGQHLATKASGVMGAIFNPIKFMQSQSIVANSLENIKNAGFNDPLLMAIEGWESKGGTVLDPGNGAYGLYGERVGSAQWYMEKYAGWTKAKAQKLITATTLKKDRNLDLTIARVMLAAKYKEQHYDVANTIDAYGEGLGSGYHYQIYNRLPASAMNNSNNTIHIQHMTIQAENQDSKDAFMNMILGKSSMHHHAIQNIKRTTTAAHTTTRQTG